MALKYAGIRGLGALTPELRSNLLRLSRAMKASSAAQRTSVLPNEASVARAAGLRQTSGYSAGGRSATVTFGQDIDKPTSEFLLARGVGGLVYVAQDTGIVYIWDGVQYKSSTFT